MLVEEVTETEIFFRKDLVHYILENQHQHSYLTDWYKECKSQLSDKMKSAENYSYLNLGEIGRISFPYYKMGAVTTNNLFGIDELIILAFYHSKFRQNKRSRLLDLGANVGFHTIAAAKTGYKVDAYEPDPEHFRQLNKNITSNSLQTAIDPYEVAISTRNGVEEFVRVEGNSTSSHLAGSTGKTPYGPLKVFSVPTVSINSVLNGEYQLVKMDVEGHEAALLSCLSQGEILKSHWILEVGSKNSAFEIFQKIQSSDARAYSQKCNWEKVEKLENMPTHYSEGSVIISKSVPFERDKA